ncbi:MAG: ribose-phosphate pyrophosphokinase-like domain-containing protein, partial [Gemmatimonadota bacterium]
MSALPLLLPLPGNAPFAAAIAASGVAEAGAVTLSRFPDGETYARINSDAAGRRVLLVATQHEPDSQFMAL